MINKFYDTVRSALDGIKDGATVLIGGFGSVGQPNALLDGLIDLGVRDLTIVSNNAGSINDGLGRLLATKRVRKLICSYPRSAVSKSTVFEDLYFAGELELELVPQGTLAERMRAAGAGIPAFYTPTGVGTVLAKGKEIKTINGRDYVLEMALHADVALIGAWAADRWGNLIYLRSGRNFNPVMATAAELTIAQVHHQAELGELNPEMVVTPAAYVNRVVCVPEKVEP